MKRRDPTDYAARLVPWMKARGITQTALGELLEVAQPTVSDWCRGKAWPTAEQQAQIQRLSRGKVRARCPYCNRPHPRPRRGKERDRAKS